MARPSENPPGDERAVAEWLETRLEESPTPFTVETTEVLPDRPNVVARVGDPANGSVVLNGHTDVVPASEADWTSGPYEPTVRDGRLFGRGAADMKGALAAMVVATERYVERADDPGEVVLAFVVDEEHGGSGMRALVESGLDADVAIVGEPTEMNVCTAIKGVARYEAVVHGESCHSGQPDEGRDAIKGLDALLGRVQSLDDELESTSHPVLSHEDVTVTEVEGGIAPNVVADRAEATIDWRFLPGTTEPDPFDERLRDAVGELSVDGGSLDLDLERTVFARAGEIRNDHELVSALLDVGQAAGAASELVGFDAATDARFLIHDAEIPTAHFGPGSLTEDAHTVDESVAVEDLVTAAEVYEEALHRLV
ncbi:M20 family metallopeptidase [Halomicroarcula sp. GCM10025710]